MKIRHFLLGAAIVALMASCGSKQATETATETAAVETAVEEVVEQVEEQVEEVVEKTAPAAPAKKQTTTTKSSTTQAETKPAVDPCEAKVKEFEAFVDQLKAAKANQGQGPAALKAYGKLAKQAPSMEQSVQECRSNSQYATRVANALVASKQAR
ncbi:MAG: hypothetical protein J6P44_09230 [Bacteroidales bacterium]|nr:hypothetical protein [Bacteroidales bacterium]